MNSFLAWFWYLPFIIHSPEIKTSNINNHSDSTATALYRLCELEERISFSVFQKSIEGIDLYKPKKSILTIVDFSVPSSQKRFFVIDLKAKKLLISTWVAHGKNSGLDLADQFSNKMQSYQSSPGFYKVGVPLQSPKHGIALELIGLEKGINDHAKQREIIIHGAKYVSEDFIKQYGRCGRSFGCPALPVEVMPQAVSLLANGSLMYIHVIKPGKKTEIDADKILFKVPSQNLKEHFSFLDFLFMPVSLF